MDILDRIAERKLAEAVARGEFDDFPGRGEPLELEDLSHVPEELRAGYVLLQGHGFLPEELELKRNVLQLDDLLRACHDANERTLSQARRDAHAVRLALLFEKRGVSPAWPEYAERVREQLARGASEHRDASTRDETP